jgi:hypothetical protein
MRADAVAYWFGRVLCAEFVRRDAAAGLFGTILALSIPAQIKCFFAQVRWEPASEAAFGFHRALRCHCRSARSSHTYGVSSGRHPQPASENTRTSACATCYCTAPSVPPEPHASRLHSPVHARLFRLFHQSWAGCFGNLLRRQRSVWGVQLVLILQLMLHMRWNPYIDTTLNKAPCPRSARKCAPPPHPSAPSGPVRRERREERGRREGTAEERSGEERLEGHSTVGLFCPQVELGLSVASLVLAQCGMVLNPKPSPFSLSLQYWHKPGWLQVSDESLLAA